MDESGQDLEDDDEESTDSEEEETDSDEETSGSYTDATDTNNQSSKSIKTYKDYNTITPKQEEEIIPINDSNNNNNNMTNNENDNKDDHNNINEVSDNINTNSAPLRATTNPNYGSMSTIMSVLSSTATIVMIYGKMHRNVNDNDGVDLSSSRQLLGEIEVAAKSQVDILMMIGMILGWVSSFIYISSRIPQLRLMLKTKDVSGLNPAFFCLTFSGNLTQCLSMVINKQIYHHQKDFVSKLPWLVSSGVCIFQDGFILFLIYLYSGYASQSQLKIISDNKQNETHKVTASHSKGIMLPSPHYVITRQQNDNGNNKDDGKKKKKKKHKKKKKKNKDKNKKEDFDAKGMYYHGVGKWEKKYMPRNGRKNDKKNNPLTNSV